jgi:nucleoside-triphosphatase THEP1
MHRYIARANIENYLHLLIGIGLGAEKRTMVTKLLIEAENELSHDLEQLEFAERRVADGRERVNRIRNAREAFASDTPEREQADRLLVNVKNLQTILEDACHRLRAKANSE